MSTRTMSPRKMSRVLASNALMDAVTYVRKDGCRAPILVVRDQKLGVLVFQDRGGENTPDLLRTERSPTLTESQFRAVEAAGTLLNDAAMVYQYLQSKRDWPDGMDVIMAHQQCVIWNLIHELLDAMSRCGEVEVAEVPEG